MTLGVSGILASLASLVVAVTPHDIGPQWKAHASTGSTWFLAPLGDASLESVEATVSSETNDLRLYINQPVIINAEGQWIADVSGIEYEAYACANCCNGGEPKEMCTTAVVAEFMFLNPVNEAVYLSCGNLFILPTEQRKNVQRIRFLRDCIVFRFSAGYTKGAAITACEKSAPVLSAPLRSERRRPRSRRK